MENPELVLSKPLADVRATNNEGHTPLHKAFLNRHRDVVGLLLAIFADVNAKNERGRKPLWRAKDSVQKEMYEFFRECGEKK